MVAAGWERLCSVAHGRLCHYSLVSVVLLQTSDFLASHLGVGVGGPPSWEGRAVSLEAVYT